MSDLDGEEHAPAGRGAREQHRLLLLDLLRRRGGFSLREIGRLTGLSRATVSSLVAELRAQEALAGVEPDRPVTGSSAGRPPVRVALRPTLAAVVGLEFGAGYVRVAGADLGLEELFDLRRELPDTKDPSEALELAATMVDEALERAGLERRRILGVGAALPAPVDRARDELHATSFLPIGWGSQGFHPAREMRSRLGLPVEIDNDANLGALGEAVSGAARGCSNVLYVKVGAGVGSGLMLDGEIYRGWRGAAGELAHMVLDERGAVCYCGNRGCLWTIVGAQNIIELLRHAIPPRELAAQIAAAQGQGDYERLLATVIRLAADEEEVPFRRVLYEVGLDLGLAIGNLCNVLNPQRIVVGGMLSTAGDMVLGPLRASLERHTSSISGGPVEVVPSSLRENAEMQGALALILRSDNPEVSGRLASLTHSLSIVSD
jgi:predicted NBD/HSP70 family sugar kinase